MKVNSLNAIRDITGKPWLANSRESSMVWDGARLMEFSEKIIETDYTSGIVNEFVPVLRIRQSLNVFGDMIVVPREFEDITVLFLYEYLIGADSLIDFGNAHLFLWGFSGLHLCFAKLSFAECEHGLRLHLLSHEPLCSLKGSHLRRYFQSL